MSYYTLPSFNTRDILFKNTEQDYNISQTLIFYINDFYKYLYENNYYEFGLKYIYMYPLLNNYIDTNISMYIYNILEINHICNAINNNNNTLLIDESQNIIKQFIDITTQFNKDNIHLYHSINTDKYPVILYNKSIINTNDFSNLLNIIKINQKNNGNLIIKLSDTFSKENINIIYLLSILYHKIVIIKPNSGNNFLSERYIIYKNFYNISIIDNILKETEFINKTIDIPMFFLNKLDECNTIMGQQQMDCLLFMNQCNYYKDKNDKLEGYYKKLRLKTANWISNNNIIKNNFEYNNEINNIINNISK